MSSLGTRDSGAWVEPGRRHKFIVPGMHMDKPLLYGLLTLAFIGFFVVYSATSGDIDMVLAHAVRMLLAFGVMFIVAQIPPYHMERWAPWIYGFIVITLIAVLVVGTIGKGAQRWLDLGLFRFQPAEFMKLALPMMLAWFLADRSLPPTFKLIAATVALILVPVGLIVKQPDLGTALLIASSGVFVLLLAGISWRLVTGIGVALAALAPLVWFFGLHDYQRERIITFLDPEHDPLGSGYHIIQSKIALGSGGLYGKGWLNGSQSQLEYLPERHTDFIFAVFGEEFGLIGIILLLGVYLFIILRGLYIAAQAQDTFNRILAGSLTLTFFVYVAVNIGMVSGLLPVVGVPLPLISYGGTSMMTILASFGILMSIQTHRRLVTT
ncbi:MAG: rod shape-determining protein RodA [Gammaproteobacteria bacterium]|nr:rod shape-determining protein RodA [Gammaproteobacteria bacterium]